MKPCGHLLCEIIAEPSCQLASGRSRGCRPSLASKLVTDALFDEVRELLAALDPDARAPRDPAAKSAALRLAAIVRAEARDGRYLLGAARIDHPELAPTLERLCARRR